MRVVDEEDIAGLQFVHQVKWRSLHARFNDVDRELRQRVGTERLNAGVPAALPVAGGATMRREIAIGSLP